MSYFQGLNASNIRQALLGMFFGGSKSIGGMQQMGGTQQMQGVPYGYYEGGQGCCTQGYLPSQAFDMPDQEVYFEGGWGCMQQPMVQDNSCGCCHNQQPVQPQRGCGHDFSGQFAINTGIADGPGNDTYDGPGNDVYSRGNFGIIDTQGDDLYVNNMSINTFNTINNFYRQEVAPSPTTPTQSSTEPPSPSKPADSTAVNLTPLRNLLTGIEKLQADGVLSDSELNKAMSNPHYADMDGDATKISSEEMSIFNRIKVLNEDKDLISDILKGNYDNISDAQKEELGSISEAIKNLTMNR
ncbi:hypothetical protein IJS77_02630 [bacterium]|nr:hypothetical protein [bacterium]